MPLEAMGYRDGVAIIVIGRNEGERLAQSLAAIERPSLLVYADSGSDDGSIDLARSMGAEVVSVDRATGFTAARGRNAGLHFLEADGRLPDFVQMIDGDCTLQAGWIEAARRVMDEDPGLCAVFGRLRERFPDRSVYNWLCDVEWAVRPGPANAFGGTVLLRTQALDLPILYNETMIAGEDYDFAMRLRHAGWRIVCIDAEMALHDAAITRFGQWWRRMARAGHAFGELASRHPDRRYEHHASVRRILFWGLAVPAIGLGGLAIGAIRAAPAGFLLLGATILLTLAQVARITIREARRRPPGRAFTLAAFLMIGKYAELTGLLRYYRNRRLGRRSTLIEYKGPAIG